MLGRREKTLLPGYFKAPGLDLERDCLTGQGCDALAKTLGQLQHLTALSLAVAENKIEASGCFALATGLGQLKEPRFPSSKGFLL